MAICLTIRTALEAEFVPASLQRFDLLGEEDSLATSGTAVDTIRVDGACRDMLHRRTNDIVSERIRSIIYL